MESRWNDEDAARFVEAALAEGQSEALGLRIYTSRLIGSDPDLVLHGGGKTSVKVRSDEGEDLMHIKGSGWDLDTIEAPACPPCALRRCSKPATPRNSQTRTWSYCCVRA